MSLVYNGVNTDTVIYNSQPTTGVYNGVVIWPSYPVPEPLPDHTLRLKFRDSVTPTFSKGTGVQVSISPNIWDLTYSESSWVFLLENQYDLLEVIDGNTTGVTYMINMFCGCSSLSSVQIFDTSTVKNMNSMFSSCISLTTIPLFNTSIVTDMNNMFKNCINVQSGALALCQQASTQTTPPTNHYQTFTNCGSNTETGAAELAQIPSDWK